MIQGLTGKSGAAPPPVLITLAKRLESLRAIDSLTHS